MATRAVSTVVTYRAWDTSANTPKTGDALNHTLRWIKDGTSAATTNSPAEVDSTNAPGVYKVTLTATETDCTFGILAGKSGTANISIFGVQIGFEYVPTAATTFGAFIGNGTAALAVDGSGRVTFANSSIATVTNLTNLPSIPAGWLTAAGIAAGALNGKGDWLLSSSYSAAPSAATVAGAVWDVTLSGHLTAGTTGNALNAAGSAGDPWSTSLPGAYGAGTAGYIIGTNINATVSSRLATSGYTAPDNTSIATILNDVNTGAGAIYARLGAPAGASLAADIAAVKSDTGSTLTDAAAIKTTTDKFAFTVANQVDANVLSLNGDATAAANIAKTTRAIARGTVGSASTTASIVTSAFTPAGAAADQFKGRIITFDAGTTTASLRGQSTDITASTNAATPTFTVTALTTAPVSGDTFSVT